MEEEILYLYPAWGLVPAVCLTLLIAVFVVAKPSDEQAHLTLFSRIASLCAHTKERAIFCCLPSMIPLGVLAVWTFTGFVNLSALELVLASLAITVLGLLASARERFQELWDEKLEHATARITVTLGLLLAAAWITMLTLEQPFNAQPFALTPSLWLLLEYALLLFALLSLYFLGQQTVALAGVLPIACLFAGIAQHYVLELKGTAFMPSDLLAIGTALSVAGGYNYVLDAPVVTGIVFMALAELVLVVLPANPRPRKGRAKLRSSILNVGLGVVFAIGLLALSTRPNYLRVFGAHIDYASPLADYEKQGVLPTFITAAQDMGVPKPTGYSRSSAQETEEQLAARYDEDPSYNAAWNMRRNSFDELHPSVVVVMNETFADLSVLQELHDGYTGPGFFKSDIDGLVDRGALSVSAYGGGTCNTEFEFLSGTSLAFIGGGKYPYQMYDLSMPDSLPRYFAQLGYATYAMHPNLATNWNRDSAYEQLGFTEFLDIEDFEGAEEFHSGVSDKETYKKVLEMLEASDEPAFVFDVTMQNHSGYEQGNIPEDRLLNYHPRDMDDSTTNAALNEYLSCIQASDDDLEWFVDQLRQLEEPVVLVFFGDHQPEFSWEYNDAFFGEDEEEPTHTEREYRTSYLVWSNFGLEAYSSFDAGAWEDAGGERVMSTNYLATAMLEAMGAPLTSWQKAKLVCRERVPAVNLVGWMDAEHTWNKRDARNEYRDTYDDLMHLDYLHFGSRQSR